MPAAGKTAADGAVEALRAQVVGRVQGVGFRAYTEGCARRLGLRGYVRNLPDGSVEAWAEGDRQALDAFVHQLRRGPALSRVDDCRLDRSAASGAYTEFRIRG